MNIILEYQDLDRQLRLIEKQLSESEDRKTFRKYSNYLTEAQENLKKMELRSRELNVLLENASKQIAEKQRLIEEYSSSVDECIDVQESDFLAKKVGDIERTVSQLERDVRSIAKEAEEMAARYDSYRNRVPLAQKQAKDARAGFDALRATRQEEIDSLRKRIAECEAQIDPAVIEEYKKLKSQNIFPPFVPLRGTNQCGGCSVELPMMQIDTLNQKGRIRCEHCRRIIYKP